MRTSLPFVADAPTAAISWCCESGNLHFLSTQIRNHTQEAGMHGAERASVLVLNIPPQVWSKIEHRPKTKLHGGYVVEYNVA